jgi:hypothetical protein
VRSGVGPSTGREGDTDFFVIDRVELLVVHPHREERRRTMKADDVIDDIHQQIMRIG